MSQMAIDFVTFPRFPLITLFVDEHNEHTTPILLNMYPI